MYTIMGFPEYQPFPDLFPGISPEQILAMGKNAASVESE
jgi:hypothetical protein